MKIIEMLLGKDREKWGVHAISLVESPAVEENFVALSSHEIKMKEIDSEKRIILGAVLIPEQKVLRKDNEGNPYYIFFSKETIEQASQDYLIYARQAETTKDHKKGKVEDVVVVETWLSGENDKTKDFGLDYPAGTWVVAMKVNNDEIWQNYVKTGKVKGFSIEGYFTDKQELSSQETEDDKIVKKLRDLLENM